MPGAAGMYIIEMEGANGEKHRLQVVRQ